MANNQDRLDVIQYGYDNGFGTDKINQALSAGGYDPLSKIESAKIVNRTFGAKHGTLLQSIANITGGVGTALGMAGEFINPQSETGKVFRDKASKYLQEAASGERNITEDFANSLLQPYNDLSLQKLVSQSPIDTLGDIAAGIYANPTNAALDTLALGGGKIATRVANRVLPKGGALESVMKTIAPTTRDRAIMRDITLGETKYAKDIQEATKELNEIAKLPKDQLATAVKNLETGEWVKGTEDITQRLQNLSGRYSKLLEDVGVTRAEQQSTSTVQNILRLVDPDGQAGIIANDIIEAINNPTTKNLEKIGVESKEVLDTLVARGNEMFDKGLISPITQRGLNEGRGTALTRAKQTGGVGAERLVGTTNELDIANNLERGYEQLAKEIYQAKIAQDSIASYAQKFGTKIDPVDLKKIAKGDIVISPTEFKQGIQTAFKTGEKSNVDDFINTLNKASKKVPAEYANDLYVVNKNDIAAITRKAGFKDKGFISSMPIVDAAISAIETAQKPFKGAVLTSGQYLSQNRLGNIFLNTLAGTNPSDYNRVLSSIIKGNFMEQVPDYLKASTSFHGLSDNLINVSLKDIYGRELRELGRAWQERAPFQVYNQLNRLVSQPVMSLESTLELGDRMAAYSNAARRYAKKAGMKVDDVIELAKTDNEVQKELIQGVNDILGDYINKNPYVNTDLYRLMNTVNPFSKVVTTSANILGRTAAENPLGLYANFRLPARYGEQLNTQVLRANQPAVVSEDDSRGGIIINPTNSILTPALARYGSQHPFQALTETITEPFLDNESLIPRGASPLMGIVNALQGKDGFGNPIAAPNSYIINGQVVSVDENGNITKSDPDKLRALARLVGGNYSAISTILNRNILPGIGVMTGQGYYKPSGAFVGQVGDFSIPYLMEGSTDRAPLNRYDDYLLDQLGFRTRDVYYPRDEEQIGRQDVRGIVRQRKLRNLRYNNKIER